MPAATPASRTAATCAAAALSISNSSGAATSWPETSSAAPARSNRAASTFCVASVAAMPLVPFPINGSYKTSSSDCASEFLKPAILCPTFSLSAWKRATSKTVEAIRVLSLSAVVLPADEPAEPATPFPPTPMPLPAVIKSVPEATPAAAAPAFATTRFLTKPEAELSRIAALAETSSGEPSSASSANAEYPSSEALIAACPITSNAATPLRMSPAFANRGTAAIRAAPTPATARMAPPTARATATTEHIVARVPVKAAATPTIFRMPSSLAANSGDCISAWALEAAPKVESTTPANQPSGSEAITPTSTRPPSSGIFVEPFLIAAISKADTAP